MKVLSVSGCPYEDHEGEVLNLHVQLEDGEIVTKGSDIKIQMMDDSFIEREVKIINPKKAGDYAEVSEKIKNSGNKPSKRVVNEVKGKCICDLVVLNVKYHEVKTDEEIRIRRFMEELQKMVCITPYKEICCGDESIYRNVEDGYLVPDKVIAYLRIGKPYMMSPGIYVHPFKKDVNLLGPYMYTDGHFYWDRDTWKYVVKYGLKLPQTFIDHVMSEEGTQFLESCKADKNDNGSWSDVIKDWKKEPGCWLPDNAGDKELEDF